MVPNIIMIQGAINDLLSVLSNSSNCAEMVSNMETTTMPLTIREGLLFTFDRMGHMLAVWLLCIRRQIPEAGELQDKRR